MYVVDAVNIIKNIQHNVTKLRINLTVAVHAYCIMAKIGFSEDYLE